MKKKATIWIYENSSFKSKV